MALILSQLLLVAGGGCGGRCNNQGTQYSASGGAGGIIYETNYSISPGTYHFTIGQRGVIFDNNGTDTLFGSLLDAVGGGYGGGSDGNGNMGGSGGGAPSIFYTPPSGVAGQGYAGGYGASSGSLTSGGGGGGAGGVGGNAPNAYTPGTGGIGFTSSISGSSVDYAVGGTTNVTNSSIGGGGPGTGLYGNPSAGNSGIIILTYPNGSLITSFAQIPGTNYRVIGATNTVEFFNADCNWTVSAPSSGNFFLMF